MIAIMLIPTEINDNEFVGITIVCFCTYKTVIDITSRLNVYKQKNQNTCSYIRKDYNRFTFKHNKQKQRKIMNKIVKLAMVCMNLSFCLFNYRRIQYPQY